MAQTPPTNSEVEPSHTGTMLERILCELPIRVDQRCATVAATFITWLGTHCGHNLLNAFSVTRTCFPTMSAPDAYAHTWILENQRTRYLGGGYRQIEHILADDACRAADGLKQAPELSVLDYEVVEGLVKWLSTAEGAFFISGCELQIRAAAEVEHIRRVAELRSLSSTVM